MEKKWATAQNGMFLNSFINCGIKSKLESRAVGSEDNTFVTWILIQLEMRETLSRLV